MLGVLKRRWKPKRYVGYFGTVSALPTILYCVFTGSEIDASVGAVFQINCSRFLLGRVFETSGLFANIDRSWPGSPPRCSAVPLLICYRSGDSNLKMCSNSPFRLEPFAISIDDNPQIGQNVEHSIFYVFVTTTVYSVKYALPLELGLTLIRLKNDQRHPWIFDGLSMIEFSPVN